MATKIIENVNTLIVPNNMPVYIKTGVAKIYHLYDKKTTSYSGKFYSCFNDGLTAAILPLQYAFKLEVSYDLNYLADQDGEVEDKCSAAHIKKIK